MIPPAQDTLPTCQLHPPRSPWSPPLSGSQPRHTRPSSTDGSVLTLSRCKARSPALLWAVFPSLLGGISAGLSKGPQEVWQPHPLAPKPKSLLPLPRLLLFPNKSLRGLLTLPGSSRKPPLNVLRPLHIPTQPAVLHHEPPTQATHTLGLNPSPGEIQLPKGSRCAGQSSTHVCGVNKVKPREW